jgi:universal stress protein A
MSIKRILVPVDFSKASLHALDYARSFAEPFHAALLIVHVVEPIYYATPVDMYAASPNVAMLVEEQRRMATAHLDRLSADLTKKGQPHRTVLKSGAPAQSIIDTARSAKADLIIMATHGRTGLAHMFLGSVAERVVRTAACPVLTVRAPSGKRARRAPSRRAKKR